MLILKISPPYSLRISLLVNILKISPPYSLRISLLVQYFKNQPTLFSPYFSPCTIFQKSAHLTLSVFLSLYNIFTFQLLYCRVAWKLFLDDFESQFVDFLPSGTTVGWLCKTFFFANVAKLCERSRSVLVYCLSLSRLKQYF